jgi:transcriptional regulator with XRE-family HTH domain
MKTAADKERFVELRAAGLSYAKIAEALDVSKPTLISWAKEMQVELANAKAMRADEVLQRYAEARDRRMVALAQTLDRVLDALAAKLRGIAKAKGKTLAAIVREALAAAIERHQGGERIQPRPSRSAIVRDALEAHLWRLQA